MNTVAGLSSLTEPNPSPKGWQVIACDLDGTLLGRDLRVSPTDLAALRRARAAGLHVAICTGRNALECDHVIEPLELTGPGIFVNGAVVAEMSSRQTLSYLPMAWPLVEKIITYFTKLGHAAMLLADHPTTRLTAYLRTKQCEPHRATVEWLRVHNAHPIICDAIPAEFRDRILRVGIVVDAPEALEIEQGLAAQFGSTIFSYSIFSPIYHCQVIDVFAPNATKWTGIEALCAVLKVKPDRAVAIGDDLNDLPMLQNATLSFAMGNSSPVVKQAAKSVTSSQPEGGVAQVIDGILSGKY